MTRLRLPHESCIAMTETQRRVLRAIEAGCLLEVGDGAFVEKSVIHGVHDEPNEIAVSFEWSGGSGYVWELDFTEQSLNEAKINGNQIRMIDSEGEEAVITVFQLEPCRV